MKKLSAISFILAVPVVAVGCMVVSNPPPEEPAPAATTEPAPAPTPTQTAEPAPAEPEPEKVAVPKIFGGGNKDKDDTGGTE